jgi:uncharacterized protein (UPF0305 family)
MYEELFRQRALQDFDLKAEDYLPCHLTMESILQEIQDIGREAVENNTYKKGLKELATKYRRFLDAVEAPTTLSKEEALGLSDMHMFLKRHPGHAFGFFKYRKERYEDEVGRFCELCLACKMHHGGGKRNETSTCLFKTSKAKE